jgi:hypothetical protein
VNITILGGAKMIRSMSAVATFLVLANAPMALAGGRIIIPVTQNQTAVNVGNQSQQAGGGGNTAQTGVLQQDISQSQNVNIFVPESFRGKIQVRDGAQGQGNGNQGFDRGEGRGNGHDRENEHRDHEGRGRGERDRD